MKAHIKVSASYLELTKIMKKAALHTFYHVSPVLFKEQF